MGNTCYMNSFLQMLYAIQPLRDDIIGLDLKTPQSIDVKGKVPLFKQALYHLQRIFILMSAFKLPIDGKPDDFDFFSSQRGYIVPQMFRKTLPVYFQSYQQQDASEFCKVLLDKLENEQIIQKPEEDNGDEKDQGE